MGWSWGSGGGVYPMGYGGCPAVVERGRYNAGIAGPAVTLHLVKSLVCADDAQTTLTIAVDAGADFIQGKTGGGLSVVSGTGDYAGLHGGGTAVGVYQGNRHGARRGHRRGLDRLRLRHRAGHGHRRGRR